MKGYSFRSLTDLVIKIFKTKVNAGTGLSGGGSLEADRTLTVKYGTTAGTAAQGNDSRLSDSREWVGSTIDQAEAEAGASTTRRAFTAQRVRQAVVAWFNSISGTLGRTILTRTTTAQVRSDIGLGTAATRDVGTAAGQVMQTGAGGVIRAEYIGSSVNADEIQRSDRILGLNLIYDNGNPSNAGLASPSSFLTLGGTISGSGHYGGMLQFARDSNNIFYRSMAFNELKPWVELLNTGSIKQTTGTSTSFLMSQAATTDALNTKAHSSHTHPWSQVTGHPETASRWPTFAEVTDRPIIYPTTWDNVAAKPAQATRWPTFAEISSIPVTATRWPTLAEVTDKPINYPTTWDSVAAKPAQATRWPTFAEVSGKPSTYTPSSHTHPTSQITGLDAALNTKANTSTRVIAGTGLSGGGTLAANQTLSIAVSHTPIGVGQTWQDVSKSRVPNTSYQNTTGRPIMVAIDAMDASGADAISIDGIELSISDGGISGVAATTSVIVPNGSVYKLYKVTGTFRKWAELR